MKVAIATDHNGVEQKKEIINRLKDRYEFIDMSTDNTDTDDYPDFAFRVGEYVSSGDTDLGVLLCGTGIGMSIAANKVKGVRCAHVATEDQARLAKEHNNANIIAMSYKDDIEDLIKKIEIFLNTEFTFEDRHIRRNRKISDYEEGKYEL